MFLPGLEQKKETNLMLLDPTLKIHIMFLQKYSNAFYLKIKRILNGSFQIRICACSTYRKTKYEQDLENLNPFSL